MPRIVRTSWCLTLRTRALEFCSACSRRAMRGRETTTLIVILEVSAGPVSTALDSDLEEVTGFCVSCSGGISPDFDSGTSLGLAVMGLIELVMKSMRILINWTFTRTCTPSSSVKTIKKKEKRKKNNGRGLLVDCYSKKRWCYPKEDTETPLGNLVHPLEPTQSWLCPTGPREVLIASLYRGYPRRVFGALPPGEVTGISGTGREPCSQSTASVIHAAVYTCHSCPPLRHLVRQFYHWLHLSVSGDLLHHSESETAQSQNRIYQVMMYCESNTTICYSL